MAALHIERSQPQVRELPRLFPGPRYAAPAAAVSKGRGDVALAAFAAVQSLRLFRRFPSSTCSRGSIPRHAKKKRQATEFDPIIEYKRVQEDPIGSWSFLEDGEFATRILGVAGVAFLPSLLLTTIVYPPTDEEGVIFQNMFASFAYAFAIASAVTFLLLLRIGGLLDPLNKNLLAKSYVVEDSRDSRQRGSMSPGDGGFYSEVRTKPEDERQRDKLLGEYTTAPAMTRLRKYLVGSIACLAVGWVGGGFSGAEMRADMEPEEEEGACGFGCIPGVEQDDASIMRKMSWMR